MEALVVDGVGKRFGGVAALDEVGLSIRAGSVHALLGENGAGKSTLIKVISGAVRPDTGTLRLHGREVTFSSLADAARHGVAVVSQELNLFPDLDVLANLYPVREPRRGPFRDRTAMARAAEPVLRQLGLDVDLRRPLHELTLAQRQLVEIARALITDPQVLVLDEPTSALEATSSERLLDVLRVLRARDVAVLFVSHLLEEVMALCDEVTVLRDGRTVLSGVPSADLDIDRIVTAMLGHRQPVATRSRARDDRRDAEPAKPTLRLDGVSVGDRLRDLSLTTVPGEVVGLTGLAGAGHLSVLEVVAGLVKPTSGTVTLPGGRPGRKNLRAAIGSGVALVSGDRKRLGLMLDKPLWENTAQVRSVALARDGMVVPARTMKRAAADLVRRLGIDASSVDVTCGQLSGGNQQKVVLAKWLQAQPDVLLLDDPTRGVDVGGRAEIHALLRSVAADGAAVLLCSSDVDELVEVCDRVLVFHRGALCACLQGADLGQHTILRATSTGTAQNGAQDHGTS